MQFVELCAGFYQILDASFKNLTVSLFEVEVNLK